MRRALLVLALALALAGCGGGETVAPTPETVVGSVPEAPEIEPGDAEAGKEVFLNVANPSCGNCHTFEAAGSTQTLGPNLPAALGDIVIRPWHAARVFFTPWVKT